MHAAFSETRTVSSGTRGLGDHSATVKLVDAVYFCCREESAEALAEKVGVTRPTPFTWKKQLLGAEAPATMRRKKSSEQAPEIEELERHHAALQ